MKEIKILLVKLAAYYEKTLTDEQIQMYSAQLYDNGMNGENLTEACRIYVNNPTNEFFPRPISKLMVLVKRTNNKIKDQFLLELKDAEDHSTGEALNNPELKAILGKLKGIS